MNKVLKISMIFLIVFFLSLYFSRYYGEINDNRRVLTDEAIIRFEKDLKAGKKINPNDYVVKEKNYNNKASEVGLKVSNMIEKTFKYGFSVIVKYLEDSD